MEYRATNAALERFDALDKPAVDAIRRRNGPMLAVEGYICARHLAADRVRAAYLKDTESFSSPENVDLMSVDEIRETIRGTPLGKILQRLP